MILAPTLSLSAGSGAAIVRPTFSRDFAGEKTLNNGTGPAITFTRASNATYFDVNGVLQTASNDAPRFDHDPATAGNPSRGLLIEEARTNLLERSAEFDNAYWTKLRSSVTANSATAPDSTNTAEKLVEDGQNNSHTLYRFVTHAGANAAVTWSVFCKAAERTHVDLAVQGDQSGTKSGGRAVFNLSAGTVGSFTAINSGTGSASITNVGNGWYRCSLTVTPVGITATLSEAYVTPTDGTSIFYQGNGTSGILIWGAQLEAGAFPTSYIPTTTAAATRSADSAVVTPISSFYNQSEGTLFAEGSAGSTTVAFPRLTELATDIDNRISLVRSTSASTARFTVRNGAVNQADEAIASSLALGVTARLIVSYKQDDFAGTSNGQSVVTDTSGTVPTANSLLIGKNNIGTEFIGGHIRKITYWPKRLSNTLLQQLTT